MNLNYRQLESIVEDAVRRYREYIIESRVLDDEQKVAILETILSDMYSNING